MKKKLLPIILIAIAVILIFCIIEQRNRSASIGIIGGADGPTSIFVTRTPITVPVYAGIAAVLLITIALILFLRRKNK